MARLEEALKPGRERGLWFTLWGQPKPLAELCALALEAGIQTEYVRQLIMRRKLFPPEPGRRVESWPWSVRIYALGRFIVLKDGEPLRFASKAQRRTLDLLRALIAHGGRQVGTESLSDDLWPDSANDAAHHALETALYRLRKLLGRDDAIEVRDGMVSLNERGCGSPRSPLVVVPGRVWLPFFRATCFPRSTW